MWGGIFSAVDMSVRCSHLSPASSRLCLGATPLAVRQTSSLGGEKEE
jgi:hypothetical protein